MKIVTVVGARPQFIKASVLSRLIEKKENIEEVIIHTGQHFDENMSKIFFDELDIPPPKYNLEIHNLSHGAMTGRMIERLEELFIIEKPDVVLVYGDTNSTLAGALAASKLHIPIAHIEAGVREHNDIPEEKNRILTDHISNFLFAPSFLAYENLEKEGIKTNKNKKVFLSGDIMFDAFINYKERALKSNILEKNNINKEYCLLTLHREENTNDINQLSHILKILNELEINFIFPIHPRTLKKIIDYDIKTPKNIFLISPVSYIDMLKLEMSSKIIFTDSGGVQREAYFAGIPSIVLRDGGWKELFDIEASFKYDFNDDVKKYFIDASKNKNKIKIETFKNVLGNGNTGYFILNKIFDILGRN